MPKAAAVRSRPAIGLVVEGATEFNALPRLHTNKKLFPGCPPLYPINLGGVGGDVKPDGIAKRVSPKVVTHILAGRTTVVVCLDREDRDDCPGAFAEVVRRALAAKLKTEPALTKRAYRFHVIIVDRAFKAWILADACGLHARGVFPKAPSFHSFEGQLGKRRQKGAVEIGELWKREYLKTTHGSRLFEELCFEDARRGGKGQRGSRSLDKLLRTLGL
jgi:hypothetical protein